jgi:heme/copper-type cytochrome/quinol oxidase subunit 4
MLVVALVLVVILVLVAFVLAIDKQVELHTTSMYIKISINLYAFVSIREKVYSIICT